MSTNDLNLPAVMGPHTPYNGTATSEVARLATSGNCTHRYSAGDSTIINHPANAEEFASLRYNWALKRYLDGCANHWMPHETSMYADTRLWRDPNGLTDDERKIIKRNLGFLSNADALATNNLALAVYRHITNSECRQYLLRQAFEATLRTHACRYITESLGLSWEEVRHLYREVPSIAHKSAWALRITGHLSDPNFKTGTHENDQILLRELIAFYVIFTGIFFHVGFTQIFSMGRRNKMVGTAEQFQYILRDTSGHTQFGTDVINQIKVENPHLWTGRFKSEMAQVLRDAVSLEIQYAYDTMPRGMLGLNAPMLEEYLQFIANRRCAEIGLAEQFPGSTNPLPWMSEAPDPGKGDAIPAPRAVAYQNAGVLRWD